MVGERGGWQTRDAESKDNGMLFLVAKTMSDTPPSGIFPSLARCAAVHGVGMSGTVLVAVGFVLAGCAQVILVHLIAIPHRLSTRGGDPLKWRMLERVQQCHWQVEHMLWSRLLGWWSGW